MADYEVGFGKTYATEQAAYNAAVAAGSGNDVVTFPVDAAGCRVRNATSWLTVNNVNTVTFRSDTPYARNMVVYHGTVNACDISSSGNTWSDWDVVIVNIAGRGFDTNTIGNCVFDRCRVIGGLRGWGTGTSTVGNNIFRNSVAMFAFDAGYRISGAISAATVDHCMAWRCGDQGFLLHSGTVNAENCLSHGNTGTDYQGITQSKCASSDGTGSEVALQNLSITDIFPERENSPAGATQYPIGGLPVDNVSSVLKNAGANSGVAVDFFGNARHASTPWIGPTEDWPGYGSAGGGLLVHPGMSGGMRG